MARGAHLGAHLLAQNVQMLIVICSFVGRRRLDQPKWLEIGDCRSEDTKHQKNLRYFVQLELLKWLEEPVLEPISDHKTSRYYW